MSVLSAKKDGVIATPDAFRKRFNRGNLEAMRLYAVVVEQMMRDQSDAIEAVTKLESL